jgi:hypothetical protein
MGGDKLKGWASHPSFGQFKQEETMLTDYCEDVEAEAVLLWSFIQPLSGS